MLFLIAHLPVSQLVPAYPVRQLQTYPLTWSAHDPPFKQGLLAHSLISAKKVFAGTVCQDFHNLSSKRTSGKGMCACRNDVNAIINLLVFRTFSEIFI